MGTATHPRWISIHAPLAGCDAKQQEYAAALTEFQSTHPLRGATETTTSKFTCRSISIHAPLAGCDGKALRANSGPKISIHAPLAGCDGNKALTKNKNGISIHAPLAGCDVAAITFVSLAEISIHAPLAGCDVLRCRDVGRGIYFNPRTPCGVRLHVSARVCRRPDFNPRTPCGVRHGRVCHQTVGNKFQSTHPLRGATPNTRACRTPQIFQSTHPLRGATAVGIHQVGKQIISIHAPLAGCDTNPCEIEGDKTIFQSTHPLRGATVIIGGKDSNGNISIHAPLAGCDLHRRGSTLADVHFNPRTPCGVRHRVYSYIRQENEFQSTHPLRGATNKRQRMAQRI